MKSARVARRETQGEGAKPRGREQKEPLTLEMPSGDSSSDNDFPLQVSHQNQRTAIQRADSGVTSALEGVEAVSQFSDPPFQETINDSESSADSTDDDHFPTSPADDEVYEEIGMADYRSRSGRRIRPPQRYSPPP